MRQHIWILIILLTLVACSFHTVYTHTYDLPSEEWHKDSVLTFSAMLYESSDPHDVYVTLRHTQHYPYQNIWLFVEKPNGMRDTLEFFLADDRGVWLGNQSGRYIEMPCLIDQGIQFPAEGKYIWRIQQGMRDDQLRGINSVGLTIDKE